MTDQDIQADTSKKSRPKVVTYLAILVAGVSLFQLFSFVQVAAHWKILDELFLSVEPFILAIYSLVWGSTGAIIALNLWKGSGWSRIGCLSYWILFSLSSWIRLIWIAEPAVLHTRWPVNLFLTVFGLAALSMILNLRSTRAYFGRNGVKIP